MLDERSASLAAALNKAVSLSAHDPNWADVFERERRRLCTAAPGAFLAITHIGSTAVSGLIAKPIVDIMAGIASLADVGALVRQLCDNATRRQPKSTRR